SHVGAAPSSAHSRGPEQELPQQYPQGKYTRTDSRSYVVDQAVDVCKAVVRGKAAGARWEVFAYRTDYVVGVVLGTSAVAGVIAAMRSSTYVLLASTVAVGATVYNIAKDLYTRFGIETTAR